ncbi:MAG: L-histidine N(alpha)-methyltransferase [Pseudomonadaceae bacterium]|nr:L-histidine N(alpha)-methyltransferase [Pseudomonadaceae bacterium]
MDRQNQSGAGGDGAFEFFDRHPVANNMFEDVLTSLAMSPKRLAPKYFYNARGSELFEAITKLPEYYVTRTEQSLIAERGLEIGAQIPAGVCVVEYGGGSSEKLRALLGVLSPSAYVPIDISRDYLLQQARALHSDFPSLSVYPTCADFSAPVELPEPVDDIPKLAFFPGSSIGNFNRASAQIFLGQVARAVGPGGQMVIGVDRRKDPAVLEAAYNDSQGVTAAFNRNVLSHINTELGATFDVSSFRHEARYDVADGRIDMFLISTRDQRVRIGEHSFDIAENEAIHTESSFKYHVDEFVELAGRAGFDCELTLSDDDEYFSIYLLRARSATD